MTTTANSPGRPLAWLSLGVLVLTLGINALSAWIRHTEAGLGCADRPACYGLIGDMVDSGSDAARRASAPAAALSPEPGAKRLHRALATALVVLVLVLLHRARQSRLLHGREAQLPYVMAALLLGLSVIGPASYLKTLPAIATANLVGGVLLAACAWRLWLGTRGPAGRPTDRRPGSRLLDLGLAALLLQIALGGWQSANFAGLACAQSCAPGATAGETANAFWYLRELRLDGAGRVIAEPAATLIHLAHRAGALLASALALAAAMTALRTEPRLRAGAWTLIALVFAQGALGALALVQRLPLAAVLAHHTVATLLLLAYIHLRHCLRTERAA